MRSVVELIRNIFGQSVPLTICVPVFKGEEFVSKTLQSIVDQSFSNFRCIISLDYSNDNTIEVIRPFLNDKRISLFKQKARLGWVGNVNFLLKKARTRYVCIMPHDDIIYPTYIEKLMDVIEGNEKIAVAYSDIKLFGGQYNGILSQKSITGSKIERVTDYLENHYNAILFRGIVNREKVGSEIFLNSNKLKDFSEDTLWGLRMALHGDLVRCSEVLYRKQYLESSYHRSWQGWPLEKKIEAWIFHCKTCHETVIKDKTLNNYTDQINESVMKRLHQEKLDLWHRHLLQEQLKSIAITTKAKAEIFNIYD